MPFLYVTRDIIPIEVCATRPKKHEEKQKRIKRKFSSGEAAARRDEEKSAKWREKKVFKLKKGKRQTFFGY